MRKTLFLPFILTLYFFTSCHHRESHNEHHGHHHHQTEHDGHDSEETAEVPSDEIILPKEKAEQLGIETRSIAPEPFSHIIKTSGQISGAQGDEYIVTATAPGIVSFGSVSLAEGSPVKNGAVLVSLSAQQIIEGDPTEKLRIAYETARKEFERAQILVEDKIISEKEFDSARQNFETARIAYQATGDRQNGKGTAVTAPASGYIKQRYVNEGEYVNAGQPLFSISRNQKLVLRAEVPERSYKYLPTILTAHFKTPYDEQVHELSQLNGRLVSYGKSSGENAFYVPVIFEFDNKGDIVPGSFVEVFLLSSPAEAALTVPVESLTEEQGAYFVYVKVDEDGYRKQEVQTGPDDGKRIQILSGLEPGDQVVTRGAYQVKLAATRNIIPEGHSHSH